VQQNRFTASFCSLEKPRFDERQLVNETELQLLKVTIPRAMTQRLPSGVGIKNIQATKSVKYEIVVLGKAQNEEPTTLPRKAVAGDQTNFMKQAK
jgi:hypothetical protein